jgi:opacity protein-like surface antigen
MRRLLVLLCLFASTSVALAGEYELPTLRGSESFVPEPPPPFRWRGVYAGGQIGFNNTAVDPTGATQPLVADVLRVLALESEQHVSQWSVIGKGESRNLSYGGFAGYNVGWEGVILGIEVGWNRIGATVDAPSSPLTRATSAGCCAYLVTSAGNATMTINGYGTLRARAGWEAGNFLPYATFGVAVGQASYFASATVSGTQTDPNTGIVVPFSFTESTGKTGAWIYGVAFGAGIDIMVLPNMFLRAEYEYVAFTQVASFKATINTARAGLGFKF